ncbi:MAG: erythromycin esterase family protein, partial [bacterium]
MSSSTLAAQAHGLDMDSPTVPTSALDLHNVSEHTLFGGGKHAYTVPLTSGSILVATVDQRGIDVVVRVFAPDNRKLAEIDSPNGTHGPEPVMQRATVTGTYRIEVEALAKSAPPGRYAIAVKGIFTEQQYSAYLLDESKAADARRSAVIGWLKEHAIRLSTVSPDSSVADLAPLARVLDGVDIVALGEASHGSRELFQLKHRLIEFLVTKMDFRVLALELDYVACQHINDYVLGVSSDSAFILKPWDTEEVVAMLAWLRAYNASASADAKVRVVGVDGQDRISGTDVLLSYLNRVAPDRAPAAAVLFSDKTHPAKLDEERGAMLQRQYVDLYAFMELNGARLIQNSSQTEYDAMREIARVLVQPGAIEAKDPDPMAFLARRDEYMADNVRRLVNALPPATRIILWAHNYHIMTQRL